MRHNHENPVSRQTPISHQAMPARRHQGGNATIYVLVVVALFAALAFAVMRQGDSSEGNRLGDEQADIIVGRMIAYPYQVQQAVEMMTMSGIHPDTLDFARPGMSGYDTSPFTRKIFHPSGGGLVMGRLPSQAVDTSGSPTQPPAGWYLGMFHNVEWTPSASHDMILTAYPLTRQICERLNYRLTGEMELDSDDQIAIPTLTTSFQNALIQSVVPPANTIHSGSNISVFDADTCSDCEDQAMLCVADSNDRYGFYAILLSR